MINIRPVSDLRNKFPEIENLVLKENKPVYLTKNGYGTMVIMSIEQYSTLTDEIEAKLIEAEIAAKSSSKRLTAEEVFGEIRKELGGKQKL